MGWSKKYDDDYLAGLRGSKRSAEAAGDTKAVKDIEKMERNARENYGKDIK